MNGSRSTRARSQMALKVAVLIVVIAAAPAAAQETNPLAWPAEHRNLADQLSNATVAAAITAHTIANWNAPDRSSALLRQGCALGVALGTTEIVKRAVRRPRPNGHDDLSFPSGHSAAAMASAGWKYSIGVPIAIGTGYLRNAANWHYITDTIGGHLIGLGSTAVCRWIQR